MWGMLAAVGLASDGSQPDMGVAWPLKKVENFDAEAMELTEKHMAECLKEIQGGDWEIAWKEEPTDGDLVFWTKPAVGRYQNVKITLSFKNTTNEKLLALVQSVDLKTRQQFSADLAELETLEDNGKVSMSKCVYSAPAGVAYREFITLGRTVQLDDSTSIAYGCSVDTDKVPEQSTPVRGATQYCWHLTQVGDDVLATWCNCFDPRGWTPSFLLSWMKSAAINEFTNIRKVMRGEATEVKKTECEMSEEEIAKAKAEAEKQ